jgi:hypothetical protein
MKRGEMDIGVGYGWETMIECRLMMKEGMNYMMKIATNWLVDDGTRMEETMRCVEDDNS